MLLLTIAGLGTYVHQLCVAILVLMTSKLSADQSLRSPQNVSQIIEGLLEGYDIRLRPQFGGPALQIDIELTVASFDSISEVNMDYSITIYLNQYWYDERLAFAPQSRDVMTLTGEFSERIWVPDTFFANDKHSFLHDITEKNKMIRLHGNGSIEYGMRFTMTLACMMDLHHYPLDRQNCTVEIESYGYPMQDVVMRWRGNSADEAVHGVTESEIPQFTILEHNTITTIESLPTGAYQRLSLRFGLQRNIGYFIFQTYLPSILIVMLSWVSFWINHEATSARVALGITTVLTMTTISTGVRSSLPRISYVKAIDIYLVMCFVFVFSALLEYAAVNYTYWGARAKRKARTALALTDNDKCHSEVDEYGLVDLRCSPIPSLRRSYQNHVTSHGHPPRMPTTVHVIGCPPIRDYVAQSTLRRRKVASSALRNKRVLSSVREKAKALRQKLPVVTDVNRIDKYSRLVFPTLFIVFNLLYWYHYSVGRHTN